MSIRWLGLVVVPGVLGLGLSTPFHRDLRLMAEMGIEPEFGTREMLVHARAVDEEIPAEYVEVGDCDICIFEPEGVCIADDIDPN